MEICGVDPLKSAGPQDLSIKTCLNINKKRRLTDSYAAESSESSSVENMKTERNSSFMRNPKTGKQ